MSVDGPKQISRYYDVFAHEIYSACTFLEDVSNYFQGCFIRSNLMNSLSYLVPIFFPRLLVGLLSLWSFKNAIMFF